MVNGDRRLAKTNATDDNNNNKCCIRPSVCHPI